MIRLESNTGRSELPLTSQRANHNTRPTLESTININQLSGVVRSVAGCLLLAQNVQIRKPLKIRTGWKILRATEGSYGVPCSK